MKTPENSASFQQSSWRYYRECFENADRPQGMELPGLTLEEFHTALADPQTAYFYAPSSAGSFALPLATPVENLQWYNQTYFQKIAQSAGLKSELPIIFYNHLPKLLQDDPKQYIAALEQLFSRTARSSGLIVFDHLDEETEVTMDEFTKVLDALGLVGSDILAQIDPDARHFNHAGIMTLVDSKNVKNPPLNLLDARQLELLGYQDSDSGISVHSSLDDQTVEYIWAYYAVAFDELTAEDPVRASSPREEFDALLKDERIVKIVERIGGRTVSLAMFGDVRVFPWANQYYYAQSFPEEYNNGLVFFSPGVIRDPRSEGDGRRVMTPIGKLLATAGIEKSVISFVCDKKSEKPVSVIGNWAFNHSGVKTDFRQPVSQRVFHAFRLN